MEDKQTYANELYQFQLTLENYKRHVVIVDGSIPKPDTEEIAAVRRRTYTRQDEMLMDLSANIQYTSNIELQRVMVKAFLDGMLRGGEGARFQPFSTDQQGGLSALLDSAVSEVTLFKLEDARSELFYSYGTLPRRERGHVFALPGADSCGCAGVGS